MKHLLLAIILIPGVCSAQSALSDANTIIVKGVSFLRVCGALLDSGYTIDTKDNDLMTATTASRQYPKFWNASYKVHIRIKDSTVLISGVFTSPPGGGLFMNEPVRNRTNSKGETKAKSIDGCIFLLLDSFARGLSSDVTYAKL